jgi:hypothetical protein
VLTAAVICIIKTAKGKVNITGDKKWLFNLLDYVNGSLMTY